MRDAALGKLLASIGGNVRRLRERNALTQEDLAEAADLDTRFLQRVERGTTNLSVEVLFKLGKQLGVRPADLLRSAASAPAKLGRPAKANRKKR